MHRVLTSTRHLWAELEQRVRARPSHPTSVCDLTRGSGRKVKNAHKHTPRPCGVEAVMVAKGWTNIVLNPYGLRMGCHLNYASRGW